MLDPPKGVDPAELFLLLIQRPRPWLPTDAIDGGRVVALTATERAGIILATRGLPPEAAALAQARHELTLCLYDTAGPVFANADQAGDMTLRELRNLCTAVRTGLRVCCPEYGYCNAMEWHKSLLMGAKSIPAIGTTIGSCVDDGYRRRVHRPDRWFGVPLSELTDGQWMAFRAGRAYVDEQEEQAAGRAGR